MKNNLANSPFYIKVLTKGIRSNYFYITDTTKCSMSNITADDNGAYVKTPNTNQLHCKVIENAHIVHMDDNQYFYNTRNSNTRTRSYVSIDEIIMFKRNYCASKSLPPSRAIVSFASLADGPNLPYVVVFYQSHSNVSECATIQSHGNAKRTNATSKPYYQTLNDVLAKTKKFLETGMQAKGVYDKINDEPCGVYASSSQGQELGDTRQVNR